MAKDKDRINRRLAAIKSASAAQYDGPELPRKQQRKKRAADRQTVYRFARVIMPDRSMLNCIIKDLSPGGARIMIEGNIELPPRVLLKIDQTGQTKQARVAWQKETEIGLQFLAGRETPPEAQPARP